MKKLSLKFLTVYFLVGLLSVLFVIFVCPVVTRRFVIQKEGALLHQHAQVVANRYYEDTSYTPQQLLNLVDAYARGMDSTIWITDESGTIQLSTDWSALQEPLPTDFDPLDFDSSGPIIGDFYGMFSEETISAYIPLTQHFRTQGYILIHKPVSALQYQINILTDLCFAAAVFVYLLAGTLLLLNRFLVITPLRKISKGVQEYSQGNLNYRIQVKNHDELGFLADGLNDMSQRLSQIEEDQKKFLANVSHDFRSPLTSIKGYAEAIQDGTIPPELQPKYLQIIVDETGRLTKLTRNMLELNTFSAKGKYLDYSDFDINHEIRKVIASMEGNCKDRGITFDMIQSSRVLMVSADLGRIQQVLYNLIDNAIKFSHTKGVITIETSSRHGQAFISVKDQGVGIAKENIKKIWTRFYKTDTSRGKDKKGTGLGLSIVKEIIDAHGMNIDVISTEGVGSEFIFSLKLANNQE